ncbi:hypothetical protein FRC11_011176, partial [Ceratobasidium sp. 423]
NAAAAGPFGGCAAVTNAQPAAKVKPPYLQFTQREEVTVAEAEAALAEDLERRSSQTEDVTVAEAEAALAEDLERRSVPVNKKRYLRTRVAGARAGEWI